MKDKQAHYIGICPSCGTISNRRIRDLGKLCRKCNMRSIERTFRFMKIRKDKPTGAEHCKKHFIKYKKDLWHRLNRLVQGAKSRSKKAGLPCDITTEYIMNIYPKDGLCPVFGFKMSFGNSGKGFREQSPSIDRFNSAKGYTKDNVRIISWRANELKRNATVEAMEAVLRYMKS